MWRSAHLVALLGVVVGGCMHAQEVGTIAHPSSATVVYVDDDAGQGGDGSAKHPFVHIEDALARARALGPGQTILVAPGKYEIHQTLAIDFPVTVRGSNVPILDADGWPTGEVGHATETLLLGSKKLAGNLIAVTPPGKGGLSGATLENLTLDLGPGAADPVLVRSVDRFAIRDSIVTGASAFIGIEVADSSGSIARNFITRVGCGSCISGGSPVADISFTDNRSVHNRFGGLLVNGAAPGVADPLAKRLHVVVRHNDLSENNAMPTFSFGMRIFMIRRDNGQPGDSLGEGHVTALIENNRLHDNALGFSIDAGFPFRQYGPGPSCDTRVYTGTFDLTLHGNDLQGSELTPALISFTRNTASIHRSTLGAWQYLHGARYTIDDPDGTLAGFWLDHAEVDPFTGGVCDADKGSEELGNTLVYNGAKIAPGYTVPAIP